MKAMALRMSFKEGSQWSYRVRKQVKGAVMDIGTLDVRLLADTVGQLPIRRTCESDRNIHHTDWRRHEHLDCEAFRRVVESLIRLHQIWLWSLAVSSTRGDVTSTSTAASDRRIPYWRFWRAFVEVSASETRRKQATEAHKCDAKAIPNKCSSFIAMCVLL